MLSPHPEKWGGGRFPPVPHRSTPVRGASWANYATGESETFFLVSVDLTTQSTARNYRTLPQYRGIIRAVSIHVDSEFYGHRCGMPPVSLVDCPTLKRSLVVASFAQAP